MFEIMACRHDLIRYVEQKKKIEFYMLLFQKSKQSMILLKHPFENLYVHKVFGFSSVSPKNSLKVSF